MAVVYHWKHGWIPLDHLAALQKAHGSKAAAARILDRVHNQPVVKVQPVKHGDHIYYTVTRDGKPFTLSNSDVISKQQLPRVRKVAEELPRGLNVQYKPARARVIGSRDYWSIDNGDREIAKAESIDTIVERAKTALKNLSAPKRPKPEPLHTTKPASHPRRRIRIINHGDGHTTTYYSDGTAYDNELGWIKR